MLVDKYRQLNFIGDVWEPRYSTKEVLIAKHKIDRSKLDIKFTFKNIRANERHGDMFLARKDVGRKIEMNNGLPCYVVPLSKFQILEVSERSELDLK